MKEQLIKIKNPIPLYWAQKFRALLNNNTNEMVILKFLKFANDEEKKVSRAFQND